MNRTIAITGNTFPVKDALKALGGRWNADSKAWMVPADRAEEARKLVSSAAQPRKAFNPYAAECREGGSRYRGGHSYRTASGRFVLGDDD